MTGTRAYGLAAVGLLLVLIALTVPVAAHPAHPAVLAGLDHAWLRLMLGTRAGPLTAAARALNLAWAGVVYGVLCLVAVGVLLARRRFRAAAYVAATVVVATRLGALLKVVIDRPRPPIADRLFHPGGLAFPSGHSVDAAALLAALAVTAVATRPGRRWTAAIVTVAAVLVAAAMWSRTYAGVHWLTDTIAGVLLGVAVACALRWAAAVWIRAVRSRRSRRAHHDRPEADVDAPGGPS